MKNKTAFSRLTLEAWEDVSMLIETYESFMKAIALHVLHDEMDAEDVVQEVAILLYEKSVQLDYSDSRSVKKLLALIVRGKAIDVLRKQRRTTTVDTQDATNERLFGAAPEEENTAEEFRRLLRHLKVEDANLIFERIYYQFSYRDLAIVYGKTEASLRKRVQRILRKLEKHLKGDELL